MALTVALLALILAGLALIAAVLAVGWAADAERRLQRYIDAAVEREAQRRFRVEVLGEGRARFTKGQTR